MSDSEASRASQSDDEVNDLFGEDEDVELNESSGNTGANNENDGGNALNDDNDDEEEEEEDTKLLQAVDITIPRHAASHKPDDETYMLKLPVFLNVDAHPFDPNDFKEKLEKTAAEREKSNLNAKEMKNDTIAEKLLNENTIRWRYSNSGNDEIIKQSNAHFVQWSDGLTSLKIGQELFDFRPLPITDQFLARSYVEHEILQNDSAFTKTASLLPTSTSTDTHRKLTQAVKNIQKKEKILSALTHDDPMLKQRKADEDERKTLKMKRQLEQRRRLQEERLGKSDTPSIRGDSYSSYNRPERSYAYDDYDEDDGFVANDDEEQEEELSDDELEAAEEEFEKGAERLKNLKQQGDSKYRASPAADDSEDRRKRRRIIDSDEEDE
ncbi:hypothetical protein PUMCH_004420 [Australozyma saopauloensis]|uniref:RNA polymerase-associated protein LEO1 n=1 Tax=Australozyma saopauloensis TaxID=291208 RepID=A0AAX4HFA9_9ASCO|nr:hypothetical protein PUMCH_004420 [[Candida] saopauloensis]